MPHIVVISGPNGGGKTAAAKALKSVIFDGINENDVGFNIVHKEALNQCVLGKIYYQFQIENRVALVSPGFVINF